MKRSEINNALKEMEAMIKEYRFALPTFCDFTPEEWKEKIIDKLTYLQRIEISPGAQRKYMYDVAVLTAVPREQKAVSMKLIANFMKYFVRNVLPDR